MDKRLEYHFDLNLREVPRDSLGIREYVVELEKKLARATDPKKQISLLGEIGVYLRILGELESAEENLLKALRNAEMNKLGTAWEVQQKLRLAHVYQWQKRFELSNILFSEIIKMCRSGKAAQHLDFALQHSGKNLFDQERYEEAQILFEEALNLRIKREAPIDQIQSTKFAIDRIKQILEER